MLITKEISYECNVTMTSFEEIKRVKISEPPATFCNPSYTALAPQQNGFTILMKNAYRSQLYLPIFSQSEKMNCKQVLHNDIIDWIRNHKGDNPLNLMLIHMKSNLLIFLEFFDHANPESHKQLQKPIDANELNLHCQALAPYATSSWMLMQNIWITPVDKIKYHHLEQLLNNIPPWKPVNIEEYLPIDPVPTSCIFLQIIEYRFNSGNYAFNTVSIWKIEEHIEENMTIQKNAQIISKL
ncbi:hypothetical protein RCL_jg28868.t1 [Rhizophagus clarus]|uniref:Uncharacterized protein n=1 Tax=Rhizophagus clarus TaxID=94130 RepID=A0A8H3QX35_9GLOM|nr:hypothetical protein RCL_jg28868.t1 [Rhizophagus clarus]